MNNPRKATFNTLVFVITFLLLLIGSIIYTQAYSKKNILAVLEANRNAKSVFEINNRLQELIYHIESAEIYAREQYTSKDKIDRTRINDTLQIINNHLVILRQLSRTNGDNAQLQRLIGFVNNKMTWLNAFLENWEERKEKKYDAKKLDELLAVSLNDSLYTSALIVQQNLENDLKQTFIKSTNYSIKALRLNTTLSIIVILAVAILGTLIIKRLLDQLSLIYKLGKEKTRADHSAKIKEQFLANMSHEIRTPINAVVGFANLLQKTPLQENQKQFVDLIQNSGESLLSVVNDILDISKIEAGMMRITRNPFNVHEICTSIEMMFYHKMNEKKLSFHFEYDEQIPGTIIGDAERLKQVLINLINNAVKFTHDGEVTLLVQLVEKTEKEAKLRFTVKDTGIGISEQKLSTIFERFEQADIGTSRQYGGTGLGLSIVEQIINLQGGDIAVKSNVGKGTIFTVTLAYEYITEPGVLSTPIAENNMMNDQFNGCKILVAEDNKTNQVLVKFILQQWNLQFEFAENGYQVLELLKKNKYNLVLMDIQMPVMDGYEAASKLREELNITIPVIAMTAHVLPTEKQKCIDAGMNDYISKPIIEENLLQMLKKYLGSFNTAANKPQENAQKDEKFVYVDIDYLDRIFSGNKEFINEIMFQFRAQFPDELKQLKRNILEQNKEEVLGITHHMKTTLSALSLETPLRINLDEIEIAAKKHNWTSASASLRFLADAEPVVMHEVNRIITTTSYAV
jgi:signal transduction histidine kinase/CheY-like chemotaxis protein